VRDHSTSKARQVPGFSFGLGLARASFALIPAAMTAHSYRKQALLLGPGDDSLRQGSEKAIRELGRMAFRMNCRCFSGSVHPLLSRSDNARGRQQFLKMFAGSKRAAEHAMAYSIMMTEDCPIDGARAFRQAGAERRPAGTSPPSTSGSNRGAAAADCIVRNTRTILSAPLAMSGR